MKSLFKRASGLSLHFFGEECDLSFNKPNCVPPGALLFCAGSSENISPRLLRHENPKTSKMRCVFLEASIEPSI